MMANWSTLFSRFSRKMQQAVERPMVAAAVDYTVTGGASAHTRLLGATYAELEFMAKAILSDIERGVTEGAPSCGDCANRLKRVRAALAVLEPAAASPITPPADPRMLH